MQGTHLFPSVPDGLLEQVDEVGRAELAQRGKRICAGINGLGQDLLVDSVAAPLAGASAWNRWGHELGNSWRNHCDKRTPTRRRWPPVSRAGKRRRRCRCQGAGCWNLAVQSGRLALAAMLYAAKDGTMANGRRGRLGELRQKPLPLWSSSALTRNWPNLRHTIAGR